MAEFDDASSRRIERGDDQLQPCGRIFEARRELKEKASHLFLQDVRNAVELDNQPPTARKAFFVSNALVYFDGIAKARWGVTIPAPDCGRLGPAIKRGVELHGAEYIRVIGEPIFGFDFLRGIKNSPPMRIKPTGTSHMYFHANLVCGERNPVPQPKQGSVVI